MLPIHLPMLRGNNSAEGFHKSHFYSGSTSKNAKYSPCSLPRRLVLNKSVQKTSFDRQRKKALNLLSKLGLMINLEKLALEPSQSTVYIGAHVLLEKRIVCPTQERVTKIKEACLNLRVGSSAQDDHLLGLVASCIELVPNTRLYMRPIQLHLLQFWRPATMPLQMEIPFNKQLQNHLQFC